jgi:peptidoglycan hydrolase-like protein with peptidoglycan-binding domain
MRQKRKFLVCFLTVLCLALVPVQMAFGASAAVLEKGMNGDQVLNLQKDLKKLGFFNEDPTGYFGDITYEAVLGFQKKYGLDQDGRAGVQTLGKIEKLLGSKASSRGSTTRLSIVSYAKNFLGVNYVWGGTTPKGFDCSGFVKYVFKKFGVVLDRVSSSQATQGAKVKKTELQPGDLVFFDTNGGHNRINHVGMYIGSGNFIQASSDYSEVVISSLEDGFYANTYMTARRVLK